MPITLKDQKNKYRSLALIERPANALNLSNNQKYSPFKLCWSDETVSKNVWISHGPDWVSQLKQNLKKIVPFLIKDIQEKVSEERQRKRVEVEVWTVKNEAAVKVKKVFFVDEADESEIRGRLKKINENKDFERWKDCDNNHFIQWIPVIVKELPFGDSKSFFKKIESESHNPELKVILNDLITKKSWEDWVDVVNAKSERCGEVYYWNALNTVFNQKKIIKLYSHSLNDIWFKSRENQFGLFMPLLKSMVIKSKGKLKMKKEDWFKCWERWGDDPSELYDLIDQQTEAVGKDWFIPDTVQTQLNYEEKNSQWYLHSEKGWASLGFDKGVFRLEWAPYFEKAHLFVNADEVQRAYALLERADTYSVLEMKSEVVQSSPIHHHIELSNEGHKFESYQLMTKFKEVVQKETQEITSPDNEKHGEDGGLKEVKRKRMRL